MAAIALALASSLSWGVADFIGGLQARRFSVLAVMLVSQLAGLLGCAIVVLASGAARPEASALVAAAVAGFSAALSLAALYRALAIGTMSVVAPISSIGAALPVVVGLTSGDRPGALQMAGLAVAVAGVVAASAQGSHAGIRALGRQRRSVWLALTAAVGSGGFLVAMDTAADGGVFWALLVARTASVIIFTTASAIARPHVPLGRADISSFVLIGVLDVIANGLYALAATTGALTIVGVLAALYPVMPVVLAQLLLHERLRTLQWCGVAATFAGVALVVAG